MSIPLGEQGVKWCEKRGEGIEESKEGRGERRVGENGDEL